MNTTTYLKLLEKGDEKLTDKELYRFYSHVNKTDTCWLWKAHKDKDKYGSFKWRYYTLQAHRLSFIISNGSIDVNLFVLHKCDNPPCVNPEHLYQGTHKQNVLDAIRGVRYRYKLTKQDIIDIKELLKSNTISQTDIAIKYKIHQSTISHIICGRGRRSLRIEEWDSIK